MTRKSAVKRPAGGSTSASKIIAATWMLVAVSAIVVLLSAGAARADNEKPGSDLDPELYNQELEASDLFSPEAIERHILDPREFRAYCEQKLAEAEEGESKADRRYHQRAIERLNMLDREHKVELSLEDAMRMALENNYNIHAESYNPAIETTRIVEAESAFDAIFLTNVTKNVVDQPTGSPLAPTSTDVLDVTVGLRKLLPTGMQVGFSYNARRTFTNLQFQTINPEHAHALALEFRQPLLRGFGIDFNLSQIKIAKDNRQISEYAFRRQVRDTLRDVEERYWRLVQARREAVISVRLLSEFEKIYDNLYARRNFDITPVQLNATEANLQSTRAEFVQVRNNLFNAEDNLLVLLNGSDEMNLGKHVEVVPTDFMHVHRIVVDPWAEVEAALQNRPEIKEQELRLQIAQTAVGQARNQELPRLDLTFRTTINGLNQTFDNAFDEVTTLEFIQYFVGVEFEVPVGNRGPRAATKRAKLQQSQAVQALRALIEQVILDVNVSARSLLAAYDQIAPSFKSANARSREVDSIRARAERKDLNTLNSELNSLKSLASSRRAILNALANYNIAIIDLERAKGTLLPYNNVVIESDKTDFPAQRSLMGRGTAKPMAGETRPEAADSQ